MVEKERRTCSKLKPWLFFVLELTIFISLGSVAALLIGSEMGIYAGIIFIVLALHKTKAVGRLERVLERTEEVRKVKFKERYREYMQ